MKRHQSIVPLSREHHHGLLCCWKIRQGIQKRVEAERIAAYVHYFWNQHLKRHFKEEEHWLFQPVANTTCQQAIAEHRELSVMVEMIASEPATGNLAAFADLLSRHIRFEERVVFPLLEKILPETTLTMIGAELDALHQHPGKDDYADLFWLNG